MNGLTLSSLAFGLTSLFLAIAIPVFSRQKAHLMWAFFNFLVFLWGVCLFGVSIYGLNRSGSETWWRLANIIGLLIPPFFCEFITLFCGHPRRIALKLSYLYSIVFIYMTISGALDFRIRYIFNSFYYPSAGQFLYHSEIAFWIYYIFYGHWILFSSYKTAGFEKKIQIKYLFIALFIGFSSGGITHWLIVYGLNIHPAWNFFISIYALLVTYAIFRHRMLGIDIVIRRSLVYTLLLSVATGVYFLTISAIEHLFQKSVGYSTIYSLVIMSCVILMAEPLRIKIQKYIDISIFKGSLSDIYAQNEMLLSELMNQDRLKAVATLAAGMAHEIKNPLTSIRTFAQYLPEKYDDPEFRTKFQRIVVDEVDRVNNIVKQLLEFSKPEELKLARSSTTPLIDEVLALLNSNLLAHKIDLVRDFGSDAQLMIDRNQIKQALLNIFLNSIQAMPSGGTLTVSTHTLVDGSYEICIQDTGSGISKEALPHIFDPFYTTKDGGTGLGLSIVHGIIEKHGGKINVQSSPKGGTSINVFLKNRS